jgi:hypothetical protein
MAGGWEAVNTMADRLYQEIKNSSIIMDIYSDNEVQP